MPTKLIDYGLIFFKRTLPEVYAELNDPQLSNKSGTSKKYDFIQLGISDTTRQLTNSDIALAFGDNYKVELVTACDKVLLDVTDNFFIRQFVNSETGLINFYWEMINVGQSFYVDVHLRITHYNGVTKLSDLKVYSNPFHIQEDTSETTEFTYWSNRFYDGFDYPTSSAKCRIRLRGVYTKPTRATELQTYTQVASKSGQGRVIHNRSTKVLNYNWLVEYYNNQGVEAFESLVGSDVVYINDIRATTIVPSTEDVLGTSNFYKGAWIVNLDRTETYVDSFQIALNFALTPVQPFGIYTTIPATLIGQFNQAFTLGTGTLTIYNELGGIVATYNESDISIVGNTFEINISAISFANGNYYINFTSGLFLSIFAQTLSISGNYANAVWPFTKGDGDWLLADWNNPDFFTT